MSKKQPTPIEKRWRRHHTRMRLLKSMRNDDPLEIGEDLQRHRHLMTKLEIHVQDEAEYFARRREEAAELSDIDDYDLDEWECCSIPDEHDDNLEAEICTCPNCTWPRRRRTAAGERRGGGSMSTWETAIFPTAGGCHAT